LGEAHYGVEGSFGGDQVVDVLEGLGEVSAWQGGTAWIVVVEGAIDDAFEFCLAC
jgi:hypothetical protein